MINDDIIKGFVRQQKEPTIAFLKKHFSLSETECEDIFQDSFIVLHERNRNEVLLNTNASLSTYFNGICCNKARELLRAKDRYINIIDDYKDDSNDEFSDNRIDSILAFEDDTEDIEKRKAELVQHIIKNLPPPCEQILWGFYRDGFSLKKIAEMYNYPSEGAAKGKKHRCCNKFRARFLELSEDLFND